MRWIGKRPAAKAQGASRGRRDTMNRLETGSRAFALGLLFLTAGCSADAIAGLVDVSNTDFAATENFSFTVDVTSQTRFRLDGINGDVRVTGNADATTIAVSGERIVRSSSTADALEHMALLQVEVLEGTTETAVRTVQPEETHGRNYQVNYVVTLPVDLFEAIGNVNGNISVTGIQNDLAVGSVNGNINITDVSGQLSVGLVNGNINADVTPPVDGRVALGSVNGNITLGVPADVSARFEASWVNGGITFQNVTLQDPIVTQNSAAGIFGDGEGTIEMGVTNGQLTVSGR